MKDDQEKTQLLQKIAKVTDDYGDVFHDIETLAQAGKMETLYQTAVALEEDANPLMRDIQQQWAREGRQHPLQKLAKLGVEWQGLARGAIEAIFNHIEEVLSLTASLSAVETVLKLLQIQREASVQRPASSLGRSRHLSSRVASAYQLPVLLNVFEQYGDEEQYREFLSCLLQEMVVCGERLEGIAVVQRFSHLLQEQKHPLAWLPLILTPIETDLSLPQYTVHGRSYSLPFAPSMSKSVPLLSSEEMRETLPVFVETSINTQRERIRAAVLNWEQASNGRSEAKTFVADTPLRRAISPQVLLSLQLECLEEILPTSIVVQEVTPAEVFTYLFAAAANGGAYNRGHMGAWGRLEAWQSLSGLIGADEQASIGQILEQALQCQWYSFEAKSTWFYAVAWDLGLVSLQSDRRSLAVLAATDTD